MQNSTNFLPFISQCTTDLNKTNNTNVRERIQKNKNKTKKNICIAIKNA